VTRSEDHMNHGATMVLGGLLTFATPRDVITWVGLLIGAVGAVCSISREYRGWLDRKEARRAKAIHR
jgi:hypothetical protein